MLGFNFKCEYDYECKIDLDFRDYSSRGKSRGVIGLPLPEE